jgi:hypothetical protein
MQVGATNQPGESDRPTSVVTRAARGFAHQSQGARRGQFDHAIYG